jgi:hypothetical protein
MDTPNGRAQIEEMFGNPANSDGTLNDAWEGANIRKIAPPDGWHLFYQADTGLVPVSGIRMHRLLEEVFVGVLDYVWNFAKTQIGDGASDDDIRAWLTNMGHEAKFCKNVCELRSLRPAAQLQIQCCDFGKDKKKANLMALAKYLFLYSMSRVS